MEGEPVGQILEHASLSAILQEMSHALQLSTEATSISYHNIHYLYFVMEDAEWQVGLTLTALTGPDSPVGEPPPIH